MTALPPHAVAAWGRIRRHAVPRWMIERTAERRAAGDWQGACAAAAMDVAFGPADVAARYGTEAAAALEDDLRHFAPDLLRWHLPRGLGGRTTLAPGRTVLLAGYGAPGSDPADVPYLQVVLPPMTEGPQRLTLRFAALGHEDDSPRSTVENWTTARFLWDVRRTAELRERCGGGADRAPFCRANGTLLPPDDLPAADPGGGDTAARTEWITLLHERGEVEAAFDAVGIEMDLTPPNARRYWGSHTPRDVFARLPLALTRLAPEVRRLEEAGAGGRFRINRDWSGAMLLESAGPGPSDGLRVRVLDWKNAADVPLLPDALWQRLVDIELLRTGAIDPVRLHPLVAGALFPSRAADDGPPGPPGPAAPRPVRVRCRGEWHELASGGGGLAMRRHSEEEQRREQALRAFGGDVSGCFAVQAAWTSGAGRLPKALRAERREFFLRVQHGDTPGVLELLDAGVDPRIRDAAGRSLLHVLHLLDHEPLLRRLLAAGLDLEAVDRQGLTPLCTAVGERGSKSLVEALVAAGARIDVTDPLGLSLAQVIRRYGRTDLRFLWARVRREHPGIGADWWEEWHAGRGKGADWNMDEDGDADWNMDGDA
ncbi:ankyrin repeat domain-containing protein [Streptomyces sp. HNM0663]|uniref:Ankyrin repeat domain-containing protein n=1 Tax=Streptomyces chengmaiensis TaxID=3040919 RepID=A0ABT6HWR4_9ACTN|nr:ankyrin repeat domain-containing protein [Streptomyces chengmaiensis]MDH2392499.1 ankyrin repeat domain-containing protein [Streptomyces chengmaiensis]